MFPVASVLFNIIMSDPPSLRSRPRPSLLLSLRCLIFLVFPRSHLGGPVSPTAGGGGGGGGGGRGDGGISRAAKALRARANGAPKARRRWCVLDATRFTLFRTRSKGKIKDSVLLDPRTVALVTPPFTPWERGASAGGKDGNSTNDRDAVALVCFNMPPEMGTLVVRAEQVEAQDVWVRALAARLTSREHHARMAELYGGAGDD